MPRDPDILDRRLPYDLAAEQAVIGSVFIGPECLDSLRGRLVEGDFFDEANRALYRELLAMRDEGLAIDSVVLVSRLKAAGIYETVGGAAYLYKVAQSVPNAAHAIYYADIVVEKARLRGIIAASTDSLREAYEEATPSLELLSRAEDRLFSLRDPRSIQQARPVSEVCHETLDQIDRAMNGQGVVATATGFTELDRMLGGGFRPGELVIVAARPAMGKSALSSDFAVSIAADKLTAFFSLEMTAQNLCERMLSSVGDIEGLRIRNRTLSQADWQRLVEAAADLSTRNLQLDDNSQQRVGDIAASVRMIEQRTGQKVELIVVDYLQFIAPEDVKAPREQQVANTARRLKALAKSHQCPVVAVCAVNRKNEDGNDKRPRLGMLRESGSIEFEADVVLLLHREDYYRKGEDAKEVEGLAEVIVAKQRNGPTGTVELRWDAKHTRFQNLAPERLQEFDDYNEGTATEW